MLEAKKSSSRRHDERYSRYDVTEASDIITILSYAGIFQDNSVRSGAIQDPIDILNRSIGYGSLIMALTELWRVTSGVSLFDHNMVSTRWKLCDPLTLRILGTITNGFISSSHNVTMTAWTDNTINTLKVIKENMAITDNTSIRWRCTGRRGTTTLSMTCQRAASGVEPEWLSPTMMVWLSSSGGICRRLQQIPLTSVDDTSA